MNYNQKKCDMMCTYKTAKMCFVTITPHNWLFQGQKVLLFKSSFRTVANLVGEPKIAQEISGMCT